MMGLIWLFAGNSMLEREGVNRKGPGSCSARGGDSLDYGIRWLEWLTQAPVVSAAGVFLCALWQGVAPVTGRADSLFRNRSARDRGEPSDY